METTDYANIPTQELLSPSLSNNTSNSGGFSHTMKAIHQKLVVLLMSPLLLSFGVLGYSQTEIKSWCAQTPHPKPCEYFLGHKLKGTRIKGKSDFRMIALQLALNRAENAHSATYSYGHKCRDEKEKAAWTDCLELYKYTISRLNYTAHPSHKCTEEDAQTWLSAALTNLETCRTGFVELGVTDHIIPLMSNNVSDLISNTLALNDVPYKPPSAAGGFPTWVKPGDRKLLQASSPASQANVVVAQDGSGNYKTISEAVSAASKRSSSGRYVIYIKAGTYKENVQVGSSLKNIMFVGDGIGKTIVTGSRSVGGGSTTFNSATVGKSRTHDYN
ncbi:hypothetical protein SAY87_011169 [Trapa incisa]|uniref:Pectinesterase n=1 Tax=Trapa incisa TaxID=236973 RepID=A0AAN7GRJ3_9MYRT|nr:hypothetical protein SAY87_011169 [Trapa incisa]